MNKKPVGTASSSVRKYETERLRAIRYQSSANGNAESTSCITADRVLGRL